MSSISGQTVIAPAGDFRVPNVPEVATRGALIKAYLNLESIKDPATRRYKAWLGDTWGR